MVSPLPLVWGAVSTTSLSFDRAADYYDRTRALPADVRRTVLELLRTEIGGRSPALEIGVGTGRIGLPLLSAGIELIGIDVSAPMLRKLLQNAGGGAPLVGLADATAIPLRAGSVGSVLACHVLHLIPTWRDALAEVVRVLKPGGIFLNDLGGWKETPGPLLEIMHKFADEAGFQLRHRGANDVEEVSAAMVELGAAPRALAPVKGHRRETLDEVLRLYEEGRWSCTWQVGEDALRRAGRVTRAWAEERFGDLSQEITVDYDIHWHAYDLP